MDEDSFNGKHYHILVHSHDYFGYLDINVRVFLHGYAL